MPDSDEEIPEEEEEEEVEEMHIQDQGMQGPNEQMHIQDAVMHILDEAVSIPDEAMHIPDEALMHILDEVMDAPDEALMHILDEAVNIPEEAMHNPDEAMHNPDEAMHNPDEVMDAPDEAFIFQPAQLMNWTAHDGKGVTLLKIYSGYVPSAGVYGRIASAGADNKVKLWMIDIENAEFECVQIFNHWTGPIRHFAFNSDYTELVTVGVNELSVKLWNVETGQCTATLADVYRHEDDWLPVAESNPTCAAFRPNDSRKLLVGYRNSKILCWDTIDGTVFRTYQPEMMIPVESVAFVANYLKFVTLFNSEVIGSSLFVNPGGFHMREQMPQPVPAPQAIVVPNRDWVLYQSRDRGVVAFHHLEQFTALSNRYFVAGQLVQNRSIAPDVSSDQFFVASGDGSGKIHVWNWNRFYHIGSEIAHEGVCSCVLWDVRGTDGWKLLFSGGADGYIKLWQVLQHVPEE